MDDYADSPTQLAELRELVEKFYRKHDPVKFENGGIDVVVQIGAKYGMSALNGSLTKKYGEGLEAFETDKSRKSIRVASMATPDVRRNNLLKKLEAFYTIHDSSKFDSPEALDALADWGIRYGVTLLNEKLTKKYGSGLEGVRISMNTQVISKDDWRKSGLHRPSLAVFNETSMPMDDYSDGSTSEEDDGSYFDTEHSEDEEGGSYASDDAVTDDWASQYSGDEDEPSEEKETAEEVKFGQKLLPGTVMAELKSHDEVHKHEPRAQQQKMGKACTMFDLDVDAKEFKTCLCGHPKKDHSVAAGGEAGALTGLAPSGGSFMTKWSKLQGSGTNVFKDPLDKRKADEQHIKKSEGVLTYAKPTGTTRKEGTSGAAVRTQGRGSVRRNGSSAQSKRGSKKRTESRRPGGSNGGVNKSNGSIRHGGIKNNNGGSSREGSRQSTTGKGRNYAGPRMPAPKKLTTLTASSGRGSGPCAKFEFDIRTGDAFGNCSCGHSRADHDKVKYRSKVAQSLRVKWNQSPYRDNAGPPGSSPKKSGGLSVLDEVSTIKASLIRRVSGGSIGATKGKDGVSKMKSKNPGFMQPSSSSVTARKAAQSSRREKPVARPPIAPPMPSSSPGHKASKSLKEFLTEANLSRLLSSLYALGVEEVADLQYLVEDDLRTFDLKPIQKRKLLMHGR